MASTVYSSLPTHTGPPATPLFSRRLADNKRLLAFLACVAVFGLLGLAPSSREYATSVWKEGGVSGVVLAKEDEVLPYGVQGKKWEGTPEEAELRRWKWQAETDESLKRVLASLTVDELRVRNWLLATRPSSFKGTHIGYSSSVSPVPYISQGQAAIGRTGAPRSWEGPGVFDGGSYEKYGELLEEWHTGRQSLHSDGEKWQKAYSLLHRTMLRGERSPKILEYWCEANQECGGLADRMLGMTSTFLLSLLTDRAFLASWDNPVPLSLVFDSPALDWSEPSFPSLPRLSPEEGGRDPHPLYSNETLLTERRREPFHNFAISDADALLGRLRSDRLSGLENEAWIRLERPNRGITLRSFANPKLLPELTSLGLDFRTAYAQIVHFLFRPKIAALMFINEYTSLFALPNVFAVGIQVRTGDVYMRDPKLDGVNTVERHQHWFDCAAEVVETYASPTQRPLYFLITDSASLRRSAALAFPDRVVISGLAQHHNELRTDDHKLLHAVEGGGGRSVEEMKEELEGLQNTVAESWIFESMDFSLLSHHSGFGKIPTFMHSKPNRAILVPRTGTDPKRPDDASAFSRPHMPSCRLETTLASFSDLAEGWSLG